MNRDLICHFLIFFLMVTPPRSSFFLFLCVLHSSCSRGCGSYVGLNRMDRLKRFFGVGEDAGEREEEPEASGRVSQSRKRARGHSASILVFPVIHVKDLEQTRRNFSICARQNVAGVFLIGHGVDAKQLINISRDLKDLIPQGKDFVLGVNLLDVLPLNAVDMLKSEKHINALWSDNSFYPSPEHVRYAARVAAALKETKILYFGGFAFKYQDIVEDYSLCSNADQFMDVLCTSGPATGQSAELKKVKAILEHSPLPVALASGVSESNIVDYASCGVRYALVATSISSSFFELDETKLRQLIKKAAEL